MVIGNERLYGGACSVYVLSFVLFPRQIASVLFIWPNIIESWGFWKTEAQQKVA